MVATLLTLAPPASADDPDPFGWTERCLKSSENQLDWVSKREDCLRAILIYCEFAENDQACFQNLIGNFDARGDQLVASLPASINAEAPQKGFYEMRLDTLGKSFSVSQCRGKERVELCAATVVIGKYLSAALLTEWLAKQEETK